MTDTLLDQVRTTEAARREYLSAKRCWDVVVGSLHDDYRELVTEVAEKKHQMEVAEENLRALALAEYNRTEGWWLAPGVSVKLETQLVYDPNDAEIWAQAKGVALVPAHVDLAAFERIVKGMFNPPAFVEVHYRPTVRLDTDLGAALAAAEVPSTQEGVA